MTKRTVSILLAGILLILLCAPALAASTMQQGSMYVFTSNGKLGEVTVQFTVEGTTVEKTITVAHPKYISFPLDSTVLPYTTAEKIRETALSLVV